MRRSAEVVEWQTRTFEGRVAKAVRVQVPPSAPSFRLSSRRFRILLPGQARSACPFDLMDLRLVRRLHRRGSDSVAVGIASEAGMMPGSCRLGLAVISPR